MSVEEALGLARPGAGGYERGLPLPDGANGLFLVPVHMAELRRNAPAHVRVEHAFRHQVVQRRTLTERPGEADIRGFQQGGFARLIQGQKPPHLPVQPLVGKGIGGELVSQEAVHHLFGECDGVECHILLLFRPRGTWSRLFPVRRMTDAYSGLFNHEDGAGENRQVLAKDVPADAGDLVRFQIVEPQVEAAVERSPFMDGHGSEIRVVGEDKPVPLQRHIEDLLVFFPVPALLFDIQDVEPLIPQAFHHLGRDVFVCKDVDGVELHGAAVSSAT